MNTAALTLVAALIFGASGANAYEPTKNFAEFWPQVRKAFMDADPGALAALALSDKMPIRYFALDPNDACQNRAAKAYLTALNSTVANFRRGETWGDFLQNSPTLDLNHASIYTNALGEVSVHLKVRFSETGPGGTWRILESLHDLDEVFEMGEKMGGPSRC